MNKSTSIESKVLRKESSADLQHEILTAFQGNIEPIRVPAAYRLGILL